MPGEIIITYTKDIRKTPYVFDIAWADGKPTPQQLEIINDIFEKKYNEDYIVDIDENYIDSAEEWINNRIEEKIKECRPQLQIDDTEKPQEEQFVEEIVESATQRVNARDKNAQAKELAEKYAQQIKNPELEDSEYE